MILTSAALSFSPNPVDLTCDECDSSILWEHYVAPSGSLERRLEQQIVNTIRSLA